METHLIHVQSGRISPQAYRHSCAPVVCSGYVSCSQRLQHLLSIVKPKALEFCWIWSPMYFKLPCPSRHAALVALGEAWLTAGSKAAWAVCPSPFLLNLGFVTGLCILNLIIL